MNQIPAVDLQSIHKYFGEHLAVNDVSLLVPAGSIYGFIGPNGSGKTTTMRMIMNILFPDSGAIRIFGEQRLGTATDWVGYLPEERGLYKKMKVRELLHFYGDLKNGRNVRQVVDRWLTKLELQDWADKKVETLSKGMSQKVQFIATIAAEPRLIILDEPFSGLDPVNTNTFLGAILELRDQGATILFSTHDMNTAEKVCDYIFMIHKGRKVLDGTLTEIQGTYGMDTLRVRAERPVSGLEQLPGISHLQDFGQVQELRLSSGTDPQEIIREILSRSPLLSFEIMKPTLHDIFVRIAGEEVADA